MLNIIGKRFRKKQKESSASGNGASFSIRFTSSQGKKAFKDLLSIYNNSMYYRDIDLPNELTKSGDLDNFSAYEIVRKLIAVDPMKVAGDPRYYIYKARDRVKEFSNELNCNCAFLIFNEEEETISFIYDDKLIYAYNGMSCENGVVNYEKYKNVFKRINEIINRESTDIVITIEL